MSNAIDYTDHRYQRQILLDNIGVEGQRRLSQSSVLVLGAGGLGAPVLLYLAAAGIGNIHIMDGDVVSNSNLNRQVLYVEEDLGQPKALRAAERLRALNSEIAIHAIPQMLTQENAHLVKGFDAVVFCLDSIDARKLANRICVEEGIPFVEGGVHAFNGMVTTVVPGETPCYECMYGYFQPKRETVPVLGAMAGLVGCMEALATVHLLLGKEHPSRGRLLMLNGTAMHLEHLEVERNPQCPVCGKNKGTSKGCL